MSKKLPSVLVVQVYTHHKQYCRFMYPKFFNSLTYKNKDIAWIDEQRYYELKREPTGEQRAAKGRQIGIEIAIKKDVDWIFFMDLDVEPDVDIIEKMLAVNKPLVGGLHAARGNANQCIGHNYKSRKSLERVWLKRKDMKGTPTVDGISGGTLLVAKGLFHRIDYTGYLGPGTIPERHTADDEYLQIQIYKSTKIRPVVATNAKSWHYSEDGRAYKLWGKIKIWRDH